MRIALFGEAEKGSFTTLFHFTALPALADTLGEPPEASQGIPFAVQILLFQHELIYIRVREEGFSHSDYHEGLTLLRDHPLGAIALPGVGDPLLLERASSEHKALLLTTESDLHDYMHS